MGAGYLESKMDPGLAIHSEVTGYPQRLYNVYDSNFAYFAAAAIVEIVCIAFVARE